MICECSKTVACSFCGMCINCNFNCRCMFLLKRIVYSHAIINDTKNCFGKCTYESQAHFHRGSCKQQLPSNKTENFLRLISNQKKKSLSRSNHLKYKPILSRIEEQHV